jgi:hypothetical protein
MIVLNPITKVLVARQYAHYNYASYKVVPCEMNEDQQICNVL